MNEKLSTRAIWVRGVAATAIAAVISVAAGAVAAWAVGALTAFIALQPGPIVTATAVTMIAPIALSMDSSGQFAGSSPDAALALIPLHLIPAATLVAALVWIPEGHRS